MEKTPTKTKKAKQPTPEILLSKVLFIVEGHRRNEAARHDLGSLLKAHPSVEWHTVLTLETLSVIQYFME